MTIKQLFEMPLGKENRTGGFNLIIKTARKILEHDGKYVQGVVFTDETGDIDGDVSLPRYIPLQRTQGIRITVCWLQPTSDGKKLYVEQWYPLTKVGEPDNFKFQPDWGPEDSEAMEWAAARREEVKGKCRHGVVCAILSTGADPDKDYVNKLVEFIVTGK